MNANHQDDPIGELLAPLDRIEPVRRGVSVRSRRRLLVLVGVGVCILAGAGAAVAAGLGAFSGATAAELSTCVPSTTAQTMASGAQVQTGHSDGGIFCLAFVDGNGTTVRTAGPLSGSPAGDVLPLKALDTVSHSYVIVAIVPTGYDHLVTSGSVEIPIKNQVLVVDPKLVTAPAVLSGPNGKMVIDLGELAAP